MDNLSSLYLAMGRSIANWAHLESELAETLADLVECDIRHAGIILYSVISFSAKLEMVDGLFRYEHRDEPDCAYWSDLVGYIRELSGVRNQIAHRAARPFSTSPAPSVADASFNAWLDAMQWGVTPHEHDHTTKADRQRKRAPIMHTADLSHYAEAFSHATGLLRNFRLQTDGFSTFSGKWPEQVNRLPK